MTATKDTAPAAMDGVDIYEIFSFMVLEEFLTKKNLSETLKTLHTEWMRPAEDMMMFSWYEVALKLRMPEVLDHSLSGKSIIENLLQFLIKQSSVRNHRSEASTSASLLSLPKLLGPHVSLPQESADATTLLADAYRKHPAAKLSKLSPASQPPVPVSTKPVPLKRHLESSLERFMGSKLSSSGSSILSNNGPAKLSNEAWIPEESRMKAVRRDLLIATETLRDTQLLETALEREMRRLLVTDLDRARFEEELDATHKIPCACCTMEFLYVNLPMRVSRKAILDIRVKWSGKLSSATIFQGRSVQDIVNMNSVRKSQDDRGQSAGKRAKRWQRLLAETTEENTNEIGYGKVPRYYDQVGVCVFCAQFFEDPEEYRPSYERITYGERKAAYLEAKEKERAYWDPLRMVEEDRRREEALQLQPLSMLTPALTSGNNNSNSAAAVSSKS